jgi:phosphoglycerate dehydrogenase-like enzyme
MKILLIPGLTLPDISADDVVRIRTAAGGNADVIVTTPIEAPTHAAQAEVILGAVPRQLFQAAPRLRWVHATSSGVDAFLYPEFRDSVILTRERSGRRHRRSCLWAAAAVGTAINHGVQAGSRFLAASSGAAAPDGRAQRADREHWLCGTGRAVARRAHAFDALLYRSRCCPLPRGGRAQRPAFSLLLATPEGLIVAHYPGRGPFNDAAFAHRSRARGEVIVEDALVRALQAKQIRGAALDVAPREPLPPDSALWDMENVVMTPHTAGASQYRAARNIERFVRNLVHLRHNEPLEGVINKQLGY